MEIKGTAALVTGGGSGIGADVARHLSALGAKVGVLDINTEGAEAVAKEIGGIACTCDIGKEASAVAAIAKAKQAHGPARILVNVAGILIPGRILGKDGPLPLEKFSKVIEVNLIGTFNMMRLAAADMAAMEPLKDGERGVIVNTTSVAAYEGQIGQEAYAASKAGIVGLTLPAARDLARAGIRVLAIAPGLVATPMMLNLPPDLQKSLGDSVPFPSRLADAREFSRLAQHMIENVMLNGEVVRLDGALRLAPK
ncbi:MAG TPA: SDR family NAD(P)-dependent oxidoreductase [Dongiaceae bacterium]|jgi:NAD(P)-dependent dehydrogenase (short-subunit alcohol dehydrogenase family)|nr:SDR family NAD(P)-dependent oxidoreductase [Dongiaceae bacterium]